MTGDNLSWRLPWLGPINSANIKIKRPPSPRGSCGLWACPLPQPESVLSLMDSSVPATFLPLSLFECRSSCRSLVGDP